MIEFSDRHQESYISKISLNLRDEGFISWDEKKVVESLIYLLDLFSVTDP